MDLITGSSGFIGTNITKQLERDTMMYDIENGMDVRNFEQLVGTCKGFDIDVIHHLAAILGTPETFDYPIQRVIGVNIIGTLNILELAKYHGAKVIYPGMLRIWHNPYAITKGCGQDFVDMYYKHYGVETTILTLTNAYGPGQKTEPYKKIIPTFIMAALRDEPIPVSGSGYQTADLVHVEDVARAFLLAGESELSNGCTIEIGSGNEIRVLDIAFMVRDMCGSESDIVHMPLRIGEDANARIDIDLTDAWNYLAYKPEIELKEGLRKTIKYYEGVIREQDRLLDADN